MTTVIFGVLEARFGSVPDTLRARLSSTSPDEVTRTAQCVGIAGSIDELAGD